MFDQIKKVKFQLDTGLDLTIINAENWKRINRPTLITSKNIARGVTGGKLKFAGEIHKCYFLREKLIRYWLDGIVWLVQRTNKHIL